jgi:DNA-binding IscR family transcriptional regulator
MFANSRFPMAIHVLCALAHRDDVVDSGTLAESVGTSPSFLRVLIGDLREAGLVETRRGQDGGTMHDVARATEPEGILIPHDLDYAGNDPVANAMSGILDDLDARLVDALSAELARTTVAELLRDHVEKE